MRLIYTHNNADFDAIASQLALVKLDPTATPVLPPRLHQNVRRFLTLYAGLLPALQHDDLTPVPEYVYLVDTQKYHNIPGLGADTPVHIIDHHPLKHKLPKHFTFWGDTVGSTTTLLVERIQQEDIALSMLEATLLLMGIYEDTGSLTYGGTTPRDLQAAAWLLTQGAKLDLLRDFLTYPLEDDQWGVYDQLRESPDVLEIEGHSIVISSAVVPDQVSDVSTIAHQLANLYDPHALFVLVQMADNVQMVARSGVDQIDVGAIARHFGGGGHGRAAAALIRRTPIAEVRQRLRDLLPTIIQPNVTVRDLMSAAPIETIADTATAEEAHRLMTISGHEGYPVLHGGRVVGLLTRRAVDRAMSHQLRHAPVSQIMEAGGNIHVTPTDSLETLRQKMMDTGWGQMPVLNGGQQLIGIVTRTDLIRRWGSSTVVNIHQQHLIVQQLQQTLPEGLWTLLKTIAHHAQTNGIDLYLVGGIVRDLLLGVPNLDLDLVVEGDAIGLVRYLHATWGGDMRFHQQFGTAKWMLAPEVAERLGVAYSPSWPEFIDFATARAEFYKEPTVLPTVRQSSIKQDLHRRDFTINSMAIRLAPEPMGTLIDYYNGERDLNQKTIRVLHSLSFVDDPTRMVRAVRFEQRLDFTIDPRTENLMREALPLLNRVTGDRIRHELRLILYERDPLRALRRLENLGILAEIVPDVQIDDWFVGAYRAFISAKQQPPWPLSENFDSWQIGTLALLTRRHTPEQIEALASRLLLSRAQVHVLLAFQKAIPLYTWPYTTPPSAVVNLLEPMPEVCWLAIWAAAPTAHTRQLVVQFVQAWRHIKPLHDGKQLQSLGVEIGPVIGKILRELRRAWLDGEITTPEQEDVYLNRLLHDGIRDFPNL
ncbi:MAG: CBS domain-containing protein [Anaerolineales bacterium]|nr:CBS domain-containing protein [Anaerolineales bacterium]